MTGSGAADHGAVDRGAAAGIRVVERETVRTARYAVVGAEPAQASRVWFALHGYGQLAPRFLRPFEGVIPHDCCVIAPEGLSRFYLEHPRPDGGHLHRTGATWLTRESRDSEIRDAIRWLDAVYSDLMGARGDAPAPQVGLLGFSQGVATAMRWVADGAVRPRAFVGWAGGLASDVQREAFRSRIVGAEVVLVSGTQDTFITPKTRAVVLEQMRTFQPSTRERLFEGGHELHGPLLGELLAELLHDLPRRE